MIDSQIAHKLVATHGSPLYVYDLGWLRERVKTLQKAIGELNCTARYAVKANPHEDIVRLFDTMGLHFDASSDYEANALLSQGIEPAKISLSSQQPPRDMQKILESGIQFVATSLHQLTLVQDTGWQGSLAVRLNPGVGSGHSKRTTTGGVSASFGIWHEYLAQVLDWQANSGCTIDRLHIHVGAGVDPAVWRNVMRTALSFVKQMPAVHTLDIGGGYKVARLADEAATDIAAVMQIFQEELNRFASETGRTLQLEIEPGTWLVANAGTLLASVVDVVDTGADGYHFIKLNTGMNDILRPSLYGAQHPIVVLNATQATERYVVVGHNCESGDILTPAPGEPEALQPRELNKAGIGDIVAIGGAGAYCASMSARGYNSFPSAREVIV